MRGSFSKSDRLAHSSLSVLKTKEQTDFGQKDWYLFLFHFVYLIHSIIKILNFLHFEGCKLLFSFTIVLTEIFSEYSTVYRAFRVTTFGRIQKNLLQKVSAISIGFRLILKFNFSNRVLEYFFSCIKTGNRLRLISLDH